MAKALNKTLEEQNNLNAADEITSILLESISGILSKLNIQKVYFVDDAVNLPTDKGTFIGLVNSLIQKGRIEDLRQIQLQSALNFNQDETILAEHINKVWDEIKPRKQEQYYKKAYELLGQPQAINDSNVSNHVKEFFADGILECLTPPEWVNQRDEIIAAIPEGNRILILFDQDLKLAGAEFISVRGEDLILEIKNRNVADKIISTLFTHTTTEISNELIDRQTICNNGKGLIEGDFFLLSKSRLDKHDLFTDGIKKACLNTFCEIIKSRTIAVIEEAQKRTIDRLKAFDTYDFDHTVFKSSYAEGVWEPETLLRITDVIYKDYVKELINEGHYISEVNEKICSAKEVSDIDIKIDNKVIEPYSVKFELRHQELYEGEKHLNQLRRPIDNGDIFLVTNGDKRGKQFVLVAQECDMMVRGESGDRGSRTAIFLEINRLTSDQLYAEMKKKYEVEINRKRFKNHFFADKFQLEYYDKGKDTNGLVHFKKDLVIDLNVLDLIVFNETGEAVLDLNAPTYDKRFHNLAWQKRYELIKSDFEQYATKMDLFNASLDLAFATTNNEDQRNAIKLHLQHPFSFLEKIGIQVNYGHNKFNFGIKRIARIRMPKSKHLLDRYYQHLSRFAELHDFAR